MRSLFRSPHRLVRGFQILMGIGIGAFLGGVVGNLWIGEDGILWGLLIGAVAGILLHRLVILPRWMQLLTLDLEHIRSTLAETEEEIGLESDHPHHFSLQVDIARPVEDVFAYVADPANLPQWQQEAQRVTILSQGKAGMGLRFRRQDNAVGSDGVSVVEVSECEPPHRLTFRYVESFLPLERQTFSFAERAAGTTIKADFTFADRAMTSTVKVAYVPKLRLDLATLEKTLEESK